MRVLFQLLRHLKIALKFVIKKCNGDIKELDRDLPLAQLPLGAAPAYRLTPVRKQKMADRPNDDASCMIYKAQMADIPF